MKDLELYSIKEVAEILRFSYTKVYGLVSNGDLPSYKIGGQYRIEKNNIQNYLSSKMIVKKDYSRKSKLPKKRIYNNPYGVPLLPEIKK